MRTARRSATSRLLRRGQTSADPSRVNKVTVFSPSAWELSFPRRPGMPDHGHTVSREHLDTVLLIGSIGARQDGGLKWVFVLGAASASLAWFLVLAFAGRRLQGVFANPRAWRVLDTLTGAMMFVLAGWVWQSA